MMPGNWTPILVHTLLVLILLLASGATIAGRADRFELHKNYIPSSFSELVDVAL
jgi:hypothetical protein